MKRMIIVISALLLAPSVWLQAAEIMLTVTEPADYQVFQRSSRVAGTVHLRGSFQGASGAAATLEARLLTGKADAVWQKPQFHMTRIAFVAELPAAAGGWQKLEVRFSRDGIVLATAAVEHVGVGEVFVVAGQSNSANYGEEKQTTRTKRVAAFDGQKWQLANDPQPSAGGKGGSFMPPFGDALVDRFDVPIGFIACGIGATSVREWLPKGAVFPNPPTIESRVVKLPDGRWESKGEAFAMLVARMKQAGPKGFRAVLWHQGESDANQKDLTRTLPGKLYGEYLERVIRDSRREIGWDAPWFVAQVSYHVPGDEASADIREAQASLWRDGVALQGPDSDALKGDLREHKGQGVHFSAKGLREHAARWADKVCPWIEKAVASIESIP